MKKLVFAALIATTACPCFAEDSVKLVYPVAATSAELDNSSPAKRITPPVVEDSEYDPVTPIGQIRSILDSLNTISDDVAALKTRNTNVDLSGVFTKDDGAALKASIAEAKENERKSVVGDVKSLLNGAVNARSKLVDYCSLATFALVVLQTVVLCGQTIASFVRSRRDALEEEIAKRYLERQQQNNANSNKSGGII